MKKISFLVVLCVLLFQSAAFAEVSVAVFDLQEMVRQSQYGKELQQKLDAKFKSRGLQLQKEREAIANLKKQIDSKAFSGQTMQDKVMELRRRGRDWNEDFSVYQKSIKAEQVKLIKPISKVAEGVVKNYCTSKGYTLVFDKSTPGLTYIADGLDITADLVKELDKAKKAGK